MKPIIEVNDLSKKYRYGESQLYYTFRDILMDVAKSPLKLLHKNKQKANLKKDEFWALKDVSFKVNQGEAVGIIGSNGAGKSTLLKILSQITPPTSGEAILRGRVGSLLEVGTGFQQELTGRENIYLNGAILGMSRREINKKFDEIVDFSGVEKFLDTPVKHYSSGMYMRLAFAVAAHLDSDILIVDEVLAVGDTEFQKKCLRKMDAVAKNEGRTVLFVSHNLGAIKSLCTKTVWIDKGKIKMVGNTDKVVNSYGRGNNEFKDDNRPVTFSPTDRFKEFIFNKIWITNNKGTIVNKIPHNEDFNINLEFDVQKETSSVEISIVLKNTNGVNVTLTSLSDSFDGKNYPFKTGRYTTATKIRKNFLMPDVYTIRVNAHQKGLREIDKHENAMKFKIVDVGSTMAPYGDAAFNWSCVFSNAVWVIIKN